MTRWSCTSRNIRAVLRSIGSGESMVVRDFSMTTPVGGHGGGGEETSKEEHPI
jgi:hypothetical protein